MAKVIKYVLIALAGLIVLYLLGPTPSQPRIDATLPPVKPDIQLLAAQIADSESRVAGIKMDNQARIIWADSTAKRRTPFSVVYLHGLGGSQGDGFPLHLEFSRLYSCNLYLSRLYDHGIDSQDALRNLSPKNYLESASRAISIGKRLGDKVILMATSTGATLALIIASYHPEIAALILYSPNIDFHNKATSFLVKPWGLQLVRLAQGGSYVVSDDPDSVRKYWYSKYRLEALVAVKSLISHEMNQQTFSRIHQPVFVGYYYKNESEQDDRVSVPRILEMFDQIGTPPAEKRIVAFPDAGVHPIASSIMSKDINSVRKETFKFASEILRLVPASK
jgi:pimeloyl-ACP methyl ester carboxylesterase